MHVIKLIKNYVLIKKTVINDNKDKNKKIKKHV
jgi:hypothetical protein